MKKKVRVETVKEYEIDIDDALLTEEVIAEFESYMFELDGYAHKAKQEALFEFAACQLAQGEEDFIEGLGPIASVLTVKFKQDDGKKINVVWDDTFEDVWTEVLP